MSPIDFYNAVKSGGPWDYKALDPTLYEDFGNYNYGLTGRASGWSENTLLRAAGAYQYWSRTSTGPNWSWPLGKYPYGDDPKDQKWILEGIKDYENRSFLNPSRSDAGGNIWPDDVPYCPGFLDPLLDPSVYGGGGTIGFSPL